MSNKQKCRHCSQNFIPENNNEFCCNGCATAYEIINSSGFKKYYENRLIDTNIRPPIPIDNKDIIFDKYIITNKDNNKEIHLIADDIHCAACVWLIEKILENIKGIIYSRLNMTSKRIHIIWDNQTDIKTIIDKILQIGYKLSPYDLDAVKSQNKTTEKKLLISMAIAGFAFANVMLFSISIWSGSDMGDATKRLMHLISMLIALPAILFSGQIFFKSAIKSLKSKNFNMDIPISLAIIMTTLISTINVYKEDHNIYFESVTMLIFFLLIGRYLEHIAKKKASTSAENLLLKRNKTILKIINDNVYLITLANIKINDILSIPKGEEIPANSILIDNNALIDVSIITGESAPQHILYKQKILSGSINKGAPIKIKVIDTPDNSALAQIANLIDKQPKSTNKYIKLSEKLSKIYTPFIHIISLITFFIWLYIADWHIALINASAILIITCPCALALAIPLVNTIASNALLKISVLLKDPNALESFAKTDLILFDKTGTITTDKLSLINNPSEDQINKAASLAYASTHPISRSIISYANKYSPATNIDEHIGKGITGKINGIKYKLGSANFCKINNNKLKSSSCYLLNESNNEYSEFLFEEELKTGAISLHSYFKHKKIELSLISGDTKEHVKLTANKIHFSDYKHSLTPEKKLQILNDNINNNKTTTMIGDGINDAATLKAAHCSISFSNANNLTQNIAQIIIQNNNIGTIVKIHKIATKSQLIIKQNIYLSLIYNTFAIPAAMLGYISPLLAAILMSLSSLTVLLNSLRLSKT